MSDAIERARLYLCRISGGTPLTRHARNLLAECDRLTAANAQQAEELRKADEASRSGVIGQCGVACDFCGHHYTECRFIVVGPTVAICDVCALGAYRECRDQIPGWPIEDDFAEIGRNKEHPHE